jgi:hypothetical protein
MRRLTNLNVFSAIFVALLSIWLAVVMQPFDSTAKQLAFYALVLAIGGLAAAIASNLQRKLKDKGGIWLQPVSSRATKVLVNSIVFVWLCVVGLIVFIGLKEKGTAKLEAVVTLLLFAGMGFGRYLQKRMSNNSLLPYGISFFGGLVIVLVIFSMTGI